MMTALRKYGAIAQVSFKAQFVYRFDVAMTAVGTAFRIVFALILWGAIYQNQGAVAGLSYRAMLGYYVLASLLKSLDLSANVVVEVSDSVRGGTFSKFMTIPDNPLLHFTAQTLGAAGYCALFAALSAAVCAVAFRIDLALSRDPAAIACGLLMAPLGLCFMICYQFLIGILAFRFGDTGFFRHVQGIVLDFATGAIVPLVLLPEAVRGALIWLPFPHVLYTPAMLLSGQLGAAESCWGLAILLCWTAAVAALALWLYGLLRVRYDGVGA